MFVFDAFGNELERTGTTTVTHLYRGEQYDPALAFYYLRARYYDPSTGRFPTMDSFAGFAMDPPSLHKYAYAHADPVNKLDPSGHMTLQELGQTLNTAARQVMSSTGNFRIVFEKTVGEEGKPSMSNDNYPLSPDRPSKATLSKRLADIKLCK